MKLNFISRAKESVASYRFHVLRPAYALSKFGHTVSVTTVPNPPCDVMLFHKHWSEDEQDFIVAANKRNIKTVYHVCDNHYDNPRYGDHYRFMTENAAKVIATCEAMKEVIKEKTGVDAEVIEDSCEMPELEPSHANGEKLQVVWFGNSVNFRDLDEHKDAFEGVDLTVISNKNIVPDNWKFVEYQNPKNAMQEIVKADVVVVPGVLDDRNKGRSCNRVVDAIRLGKFVVASPLPDYKQFSDTMFIGDIKEGIEWAKSQHKLKLLLRVKEAQKYVRNKYGMDVVAKKWNNMIHELAGVRIQLV